MILLAVLLRVFKYSYLFVAINVSLVGSVQINMTFSCIQLALIKWIDYFKVGPFSLRVVGVVGITYLLPQEEQPLCHPTVERLVMHDYWVKSMLCDLKFQVSN